jgi:hypothetical protein
MKKILMAALIGLCLINAKPVTAQDTLLVLDIKNWVWDIYNDPQHVFLTDEVLERMINLASRNYAVLSFVWEIDTILVNDTARTYKLPSDFIKVRGASIVLNGREQVMSYRSLRAQESGEIPMGKDPARTIGGETVPFYYTVVGDSTGYYLTIDPVSGTGREDTVLVHYSATVNKAISDSTILIMPYSAPPLLIWDILEMAFIRNRDQPNASDAAKLAGERYGAYYNLLVAEKSDPSNIPTQKVGP